MVRCSTTNRVGLWKESLILHMCLHGVSGEKEAAHDWRFLLSASVRSIAVVGDREAGREKGDIHIVHSKLLVRQTKGAWHLSYALHPLYSVRAGLELPWWLYKYNFQNSIKLHYNYNIWWRWLIQYKLSSCKMCGKSSCHYSRKKFQGYFSRPVVLCFCLSAIFYLEGRVSSEVCSFSSHWFHGDYSLSRWF